MEHPGQRGPANQRALTPSRHSGDDQLNPGRPIGGSGLSVSPDRPRPPLTSPNAKPLTESGSPCASQVTIREFSRPGNRLTALVGPLGRRTQQAMTTRYLRAAARGSH